ncbi:D-glycero-beta-D-manno-heptose 1,7-bisphosphate 7-phosphatase [candidate division KSB1 bacterium]|nr:D-glycero-beta-D-manno-heptose 1,7-bisphosphate 7-phosphatase [candidate division KSB1 bacterium]
MDDKIKSREALAVLCKKFRQEGKKIGFTSGAFDILHAGHIDYLEKARQDVDILIVAVNSDASVKRYKGENRPIIPQQHRIRLIAALEVVDYAFLFDERRNERNIQELQPHIYFKAGDYSPDKLTSKGVIESLGGQVKLIPVQVDISTSQIIEKISGSVNSVVHYVEEIEDVGHFERRSTKASPVVFLDRDGTINIEKGFLSAPDEFQFLPNAIDGMRMIKNMGYRLVIVTNQGGIGLGYFTKQDFYRVNSVMLNKLHQNDILIDKIYFCPHSLAEECDCRKPKIGLIKRANEEMNIDLTHSYFIGDRLTDVETGRNANLKTILIKTDLYDASEIEAAKADYIVSDLLEAAQVILKQERA